MKKKLLLLITFILAFTFIFSIIPANAAQTATVKITSSDSSVYAGSTVTLTFKVTGVSAAKSMGIIPSYDTSVFELVSGEWLITGAMLSDFSDGTASIAYAESRSFNENVFKLKLKVKNSAALGTYKVNASVSIMNGSEKVTCNVTAASVTVSCKHSYSSYTSISSSQHQRTCSKCNEIETKKHAFTNACDTSCNDCGYTRETTHKYESKWSSNGSKHWHECSVCKAKKDEAAHTPGPAATETTPQKCTVCEYILSDVLEHVHTYDDVWDKDENGHWNTCTSCNEKSSSEDHIFDNACDTSCNTCGYVRSITHTYKSEYMSNENGHWHVCEVCQNTSEKSNHIYDNNCDVDCNDCGYIREVEHVYDNGTVVTKPTKDTIGKKVYKCTQCGAEKITELEAYEIEAKVNDTKDNTTSVIVASVISAVVGVILGAVITYFIGKKKMQ